MDLQLASESQDALELIISVFIPALGLLVGVILTLIGGAALADRVRAVAHSIRGYVDDPDDVLIVAVDGFGEWILNRKLDEAIISRLLTATVDAIGGAPPTEVNIDEA